MRVLVVPRDGDALQPISLASKSTIPSVLPEMPPPTKKKRKSALPQEALAHTTEPKSGETSTIYANKNLDAPAQTPVPPLASGKKGQHPAEPDPEKEGKEDEPTNLPQVIQIIKSVRTVRRTPQEILAAFNSKKSNQTTIRSSRESLPSVRKLRPLTAAIQLPPAQKSKSPNKALPTRAAIEGRLTLQAPEIAVQQPVNLPPLLCPACGKQLHHPHQCSLLTPNGSAPPSTVDSYRSEITAQSPGAGSSSPPSVDENDATELLLELSAKNIAASMASLSPTPIPGRPSAEIDETSDESGSSEGDKRPVVHSVLSQARRESSESYRSKSSSDPPSAKDMPSPDSPPISLPAPPIVQSASLIRQRTGLTLSSSISMSVGPFSEGLDSPVIERHKPLIPHDMSIEPDEINQPQDEDLEPTQTLHHVCCFLEHVSHADLQKVANTSTPLPLPRQPRPSHSLPRLSVIPRSLSRTVTQSSLPKSTSRYTPALPNSNREDIEDISSSADDSSGSDNRSSMQIASNQQAGSRPVSHRRRNLLASF
jgi:hypothetical protein